MQTLSVRQPAASLIVDGDALLGGLGRRKRIENRSRILFDEAKWQLPFCVLIHASKTRMKGGKCGQCPNLQAQIDSIPISSMPTAAIVGAARVTGMKKLEDLSNEDRASPWTTGPTCLLISEATPLPDPVLHSGRLGLFPTERTVLGDRNLAALQEAGMPWESFVRAKVRVQRKRRTHVTDTKVTKVSKTKSG